MALPEADVAWVCDWCAGLYYRDRNLRFHRYDLTPPALDVGKLLDELDRDPTAIFWG